MENKIVKPEFSLISVSDKRWLVELVQAFNNHAIDIISTWWTATALRNSWLEVQDVSDYTWQSEMLDGRVKTLNGIIHGWLLADMSNNKHVQQIREHNIKKIDVLVTNLYPFEESLAKGLSYKEMIEQIDIWWPAMLRSAAKGHEHTTVLIDPIDYERFLDEMENYGGTTLEFRRYLAAKVYSYTSYYDGLIGQYLNKQQ